MTLFPTLLSPFDLRGRTLRNRIVSTPHATGWSHDGLLIDAEVAYQVRKAEGGAALIQCFGSASVDPATAAAYGSIALWDERNDEALRALAAGVHAHGGVVMSQMTHMGRRGSSANSMIPLRSASDRPEGVHRETPVPLEEEEIAAIVERFAAAAARLDRLGWDGCDVTSLGGHLLEQFFDPRTNERTDRYGGSLENRVRLSREVIAAVRASVSDGFLVSFRMTADQAYEGDISPADLRDVASAICSGGQVDLLSISGGTGETAISQAASVPPDALPEATYASLAGPMRAAAGVPVLLAGRILDPQTAEAVLNAQGIELVAMTRAIIADPDLPRRIVGGGAYRPCISLNSSCIGRLYRGRPVRCGVNPAVREPDLAATLEPSSARVVVVGGGVAGLEAARVAALRGCSVILLEADGHLGGRAAIVARHRPRWGLFATWAADSIRTAGGEIRTGVEATVEHVMEFAPDAVIVATGSELRPEIEGVDADRVAAGELPSTLSRGSLALVFDDDGSFAGPLAALSLAERCPVEIATPERAIAIDVDEVQYPYLMARLRAAGVRSLTGLTYDGLRDGRVVLRDVYTGEVSERDDIDLVAVAGRRRGRSALAHALRASHPGLPVRIVGDALSPRTIDDAIAEGARAGAAAFAAR